jgi:hypothetical protein
MILQESQKTIQVMVKIFDKRPSFFDDGGQMDQYMGKIITVQAVRDSNVSDGFCYVQRFEDIYGSKHRWLYLPEHVILDPSEDENLLRKEVDAPLIEKKQASFEEEVRT